MTRTSGRQLEGHSGGPMLPKTMMTYLDSQVIIDDSTNFQQNEDAKMAFSAGVTEIVADPKATMEARETVAGSGSASGITGRWTLPSGKYDVEVVLNFSNGASTAGAIEAALTDGVNGSEVLIHGQNVSPWTTEAAAVDGTAVLKFVAHVTARTAVGVGSIPNVVDTPNAELRIANTGSTGANFTILAGSYVRFSKISNKYDS